MKKRYWVVAGLVVFFLYSHILMLYGALKERKSRVCIDPATQNQLSRIVENTKAVCVDLAKVKLEEVNTEVQKQKQSAVYWKKQFDSCPTSTLAY